MNLVNIINNKLKLTVLNKRKFYIKNLFHQINKLREEKSYKQLNSTNNKKNYKNGLIVYYIINISFLKANTTIDLSDSEGNIKLFYSSGNVGLKGKQKTKRRIAITKLITLLLKKSSFIKKKPVALHLSNVKFYKRLIIKQLRKKLFITLIKSFNLTPYNGCRKRKLRRKKHTKKLK